MICGLCSRVLFELTIEIISQEVKHLPNNKWCKMISVQDKIGKRPLGRPRHRWEDNIKMDLQEVGGGRGDWMELAQDRDR